MAPDAEGRGLAVLDDRQIETLPGLAARSCGDGGYGVDFGNVTQRVTWAWPRLPGGSGSGDPYAQAPGHCDS